LIREANKREVRERAMESKSKGKKEKIFPPPTFKILKETSFHPMARLKHICATFK
jgi:hypothetical protein